MIFGNSRFFAHDYWPVDVVIDRLIKLKRKTFCRKLSWPLTVFEMRYIRCNAMMTISTIMTTRIMMMMVGGKWATVLKHVMESHAFKALIVAILNSFSSSH